MITEDTRIDYERIGEIDVPSVSSVLSTFFGSEFENANLDQKLALLEAVACTLREGGSFSGNLMAVVGCGPDMPDAFRDVATQASAEIQINEGLKLMAVLQVAIAEGYSVKYAKFQPQETIDDYAGEAVLDRFKDPEEFNTDCYTDVE